MPPEARADSTRERILAHIVQAGPITAGELADHLDLTAAGIRRHLAVLAAAGRITEYEPAATIRERRRGRPAKSYVVTDTGQESLTSAYAAIATRAIEYLERLDPAAVRDFAAEYTGTLVTETLLVAGLNDGQAALEGVAEWCAALQPQCAYVSVPLRPPAEAWARRPEEGAIVRAYHILAQAVGRVECLVGHEEGAFGALGEAAAGLLDITAVHPMRRDAVEAYLARAGGEWSIVVDLMQQGALLETHYDGVTFYSKRLR